MAFTVTRAFDFASTSLVPIETLYSGLQYVEGETGFLHASAVGTLVSRYSATVRMVVRDNSNTYGANQGVRGTVLVDVGFPGNFAIAALQSSGLGASASYYSLEIESAVAGGGLRTMQVRKVVAGSAATLVNRNTDGWTTGDEFEFRVLAGVLSVYRNGTVIWTYDDTAAPITGGKPGMGILPSGGGSVSGLDDVDMGEVTADAGPSDVAGSAEWEPYSASGTITSLPLGAASGAASWQPYSATGSVIPRPGTVTTAPFTRNSGSRPVSLPNNALAVLTDDPDLVRLAGASGVAMGGDGRLALTHAELRVPGTSVIVVTREADGKLGVERYSIT